MSPGHTALADVLARGERRRLRLQELRSLWRAADPLSASAEDAHERFRLALDVLVKSGVIVLPTSPSAWDRSIVPSLPRTIVVAGGAGRAAPAPVTAWVPMLSFAASERHPGALRALHTINDWLKRNRGRELPTVPVAERSLEIFGDEKRLDDLCVQDSLFGGRVTLADLACERLSPILAWHPGRPGSDTVLVVENAAAFSSFRRFNELSGLWAAVVWGAGNAFRRHHCGLDDIFAATGAARAAYFGDLDPDGVAILTAVMRDRSNDLFPHRGLYAALVVRRRVRRAPEAAAQADRVEAALCACLPELAGTLLSLWREGLVLPQEGYGFQALTEDPEPAARP